MVLWSQPAGANRCCTCLVNRSNKSRGILEPIVSLSISGKVQIGLINIRHPPDHQYKKIFHIVDHLSKFSALKSKRALKVAQALPHWVGLIGPPKIDTAV